jgi:hypothetical protein
MCITEDRLKGTGIRCYITPGNDDQYIIAEAIEDNDYVINPEGKTVELDEYHEMISTGYGNMTPWQCPRDISEEDLAEKIEGMATGVKNMPNCVFNFHCPPHDSNLDLAPRLDRDLKPKLGPSTLTLFSKGSSRMIRAFLMRRSTPQKVSSDTAITSRASHCAAQQPLASAGPRFKDEISDDLFSGRRSHGVLPPGEKQLLTGHYDPAIQERHAGPTYASPAGEVPERHRFIAMLVDAFQGLLQGHRFLHPDFEGLRAVSRGPLPAYGEPDGVGVTGREPRVVHRTALLITEPSPWGDTWVWEGSSSASG